MRKPPLLMVIIALAAACGGTAVAPTTPARVAPTEAEKTPAPVESAALVSAPDGPSGVIAIGHSGLTGEGTAEPERPALENSWATGTNPSVNSIYRRLL